MARTKKEDNIKEVKKEETVSMEQFQELQKQLQQMMAMMQSKQEEIDTLKKKEKEDTKKAKRVVNTRDIDLDREVYVRTVCHGSTYLTGQYMNYDFIEYGDSYPISIRDLRYMNSNHPMIFKKPFVIIEDEEAVELLGLRKLYEKISYIEDIRGFFDKNEKGFILKKLKETPEFLRLEIFNKVKEMWNAEDESEQWRDLNVGYLLRDNFGFDLFE